MSVPENERLTASRVLSHLGVMLAVAAVMGVVVAGLAIPFAGVLGLGARTVSESMDSLPAELEAKALPQKTEIVDVRGNVLATLYDENRVNVTLDQTSRTMVKAMVAIEDYRYYQHGALDLKGTLRALITNQASSGSDPVQGGSSITQQMVKLTLLQQAETKKEMKAATDDTYARKIRELRYAIAFEEKYTKDWILERYLNIAYFGDGAFGVQAAARHYFDKNAKDLNLRESAMLAGLVKNPTGYDPTNAPDRARERRDVVLDRMAELNVIPRKKAQRTKSRNLGLAVTPAFNGCVNSRAPFFCDYAVSYLLQDRSLGKTVEDRKKLLYSGGLTVHTTIDLRYQQAADKSVAEHVYPENDAIGALAMVEPRTGDVKAIAQSRPMGRNRGAGQTYLNYVVNQKYGDANGFQPGSTFKAFVLAAAIDQGIPLSKTIQAPQQISIVMNRYRVCGDKPYPSTQVWRPSNSTGAGTFNLYTGTQKSVNTFFAQLEIQTGLCRPYKLAQDMGIELSNPDNEMVPSFTLGVADVSPLEMAEAYATFAGRGLHCSSRPVTQIVDANGNQLKEYPSNCRQVLPSAVADAVNDILKGVQEPGGFGNLNGVNLTQQSAAKTGTTQEGKAVWFVGYTPQLATAAMIAGANDRGQPIKLAGQTVGGEYIATASGSGFAGPMWGDAMKVIEQWLDDTAFTPPSTTEISGVLTQVPSTGGLSLQEAQRILKAAGFSTSVGGYRDSSYAVGTVAYTSPAAGETLASGATIVIYQSDGTPYVPPPPPPPPAPAPAPAPDRPDKPKNDGGGGGGGGDGRGGNNGNGGGRG